MKKLSVNAFDVLVVEILLAVDKWVHNTECVAKVTICVRARYKIRFLEERSRGMKIDNSAIARSIFQDIPSVEEGKGDDKG